MDRLSPKQALKEKVVLLYEQIFKGEELDRRNVHFWEEFFLLWPNCVQLEHELTQHLHNYNVNLKVIVNKLVFNCVAVIKEDCGIRCVNALQTLCAIIKCSTRVFANGFGSDLIDLLFGFDNAEKLTQDLFERLCLFLVGDYPATLVGLSLRLLLIIATSADNVSQNILLEYLLLNSVFDALIHLLGVPSRRHAHGRDVVILLTLLVNYRKYENVNPYIIKLSILDDELALNGFSHTVSSILSKYNKKFQQSLESTETSGFLASFTNLVGSMFVAEDAGLDCVQIDEAMLLALYEAVHLNRNFITTLTTVPTESNGNSEVLPASVTKSNSLQESDAHAIQNPLIKDVYEFSNNTNLLMSFLTYSSVVLQELRSENNQNASKLCAIILTCISEDQYANTLMHDVNMTFKVPLYRAPMRHRKCAFDKTVNSRTLACAVLDLCVEFLLSHMMKSLPCDLYLRILGVVHRILCYEKKCRVRLVYSWRSLWNALAVVLKFVVQSESYLITQCDVFLLCQRLITIINLFITFGDTFLPNPTSYDELYYEIIRNGDTFDSLYSMGLRFSSSENNFKDAALKLCNNMVNIRGIITHFKPKIEQLDTTAVTEQDVLKIVRSNYDSLTLKLQENLDSYERYNEKPKETSFFVSVTKLIVVNTRSRLQNSTVDHQTVLNELTTIK